MNTLSPFQMCSKKCWVFTWQIALLAVDSAAFTHSCSLCQLIRLSPKSWHKLQLAISSLFFSQKVQGTNRCWVNRVQSSPCFISAATANIWIRHGLLHVHWRLLSEFKFVWAPNTTQTLLQAHSIKIYCMTRYGPHLGLGVLFETFVDVLCIQRNTNMNDLRLRSVVCALWENVL